MIVLSNERIRRALVRYRHVAEPGRLHLLGIRGAMPAGPASVQATSNRPNAYNDTIALFGERLQLFAASVDPGATWTAHPSNPAGCAHLCNGAYLYQFGDHHGHPALVQAAPVKVWRDRDKDFAQDPHERVESGWFGINIHAGGASPEVGDWSAGCQIIHGGWTGGQWTAFYAALKASGQQSFRYFLLDAKDLA